MEIQPFKKKCGCKLNFVGGGRVYLSVFFSSAGSAGYPAFESEKSYREIRADFEAEFERRYVAWLLDRHGGNISAAAREAKMDRKHLYDLARKRGLRGDR